MSRLSLIIKKDLEVVKISLVIRGAYVRKNLDNQWQGLVKCFPVKGDMPWCSH